MSHPRVAVAQLRAVKADYAENIRRIGATFRQITQWDQPPDVVVFPETITSGYFLEGGILDVAVPAGKLFKDLEAQHRSSGAQPLDVVVGFYEEYRNHYHNAAMYASLGHSHSSIVHVHRKLFLPTYGVFDEARFVQAGDRVRAFDTTWGRAAILVCEDAWHSVVPTLAALDGAQIMFIPTASPARGVNAAKVVAGVSSDDNLPASLEYWERLARMIAGEHGVYVAMAQLVGFEGGKGFPGASLLVGPTGTVLGRGALFDETIIVAECDLRDVTRARAASPLLADLSSKLPQLLGEFRKTPPPVRFDESKRHDTVPPATSPSTIPVQVARRSADPFDVDAELLEKWLVAFLREEVVELRGFSKGIVGLSGGVDSSLIAYLATKALGSENVIGVRMPYATSSMESRDHAALVASELGIQLETVDITNAVDGYAQALPRSPSPPRLGNVMARMRMITLFDLSAALGALPLGTGNKTERLLGYFTWHADDSPPVNALGDLFKTEVWALAKHVGVPDAIVSKPATADLIKGQTDEGDLGLPYARADLILYWLLHGFTTIEIEAKGFSDREIELVNGRLSSTHWKRRLPTVAMVSQTAIGEYYLRPVDY